MNESNSTRDRLIRAAIEVFAEHGFHGGSTREICRRAAANTAAIHYHFGDKAELYREVFRSGFQEVVAESGDMLEPGLALSTALARFYRPLVRRMEADPRTEPMMRLHAREEAEPSGILGDLVLRSIRAYHDPLIRLLQSEFDLETADLELERLVLSLVGLAVVYFYRRNFVATYASGLLQGEDAVDVMVARLSAYAVALIEAERQRRRDAADAVDAVVPPVLRQSAYR